MRPTHSLQRLLFLLLCIHLSSTDNNTDTSPLRSPRVSGRIVKIYTHPKNAGFKCNSEGFHEDPDNCAIFYRCVATSRGRFTTFRFQCGPNTVFDPETGICNFPSNARRLKCATGRLAPTAQGSNENEIDSNEPDLPPPSPISTRNPLPINKKLELTTIKIKPVVTITTQKPIALLTMPSTASQVQQFVTSKLKPIPSVTQITLKDTGDQCTTDGFMGDSRNCRKFYRCVANGRGGFIRYEFMCSESTVWDDNTQACNHAWAARSSRCGRADIINSVKVENENDIEKHCSKLEISTQNPLQNMFGDRLKDKSNQINFQSQTSPTYSPKTVTTIQPKKQTSAIAITTHTIKIIKAISKTPAPIAYKQKTTEDSQGYYGSNDVQQDDENDTTPPQSSSTTTTERNKNNECTSSGFMGDADDCKKFYRCVDNGRGGYTRYEFTCGEGTVWDSSTDACNHAWAVKECGGKGKEDTNKEEQTTKKETTTSQTTTTSKPPKTTSRPVTEETTDEGDDDDDNGYNRPTQRPQPQQTSSTEKITTTEKAKPSSNKDNKCTSSGFMGDSDDCKKFYRCVDNGRGGFIKYEFTCGEGTVWDSNIEACNHDWAVKECGGKKEDSNNVEDTTLSQTSTSIKPTQTTSKPTTDDNDDNDQGYNQPTQTQQPPDTTTTEKSKPPNNKNNDCKSSGFMGDTEDCKKFYRCVDNGRGGYTRYEFSCGEGTVWDSNAEACNHEWAVKECGQKSKDDDNKVEQTTKSDSTSAATSQSTTEGQLDDEDPGYGQPIQDEEVTSSTTAKSDTSNESDQCTSSGFIGDSKDCKKFYRCVDNGQGGFIRYEFSCGEGTVWDQSNEACNHDWAVKECGGRPASENDKVDKTTQSSTQSQQTTTESEGGDSGYTTSSHSSTTSQKPEGSSDQTKCSKEGFMGDTKDCKKFYRCVDNGKGGYTKYEFTCGDGTVWDQEIQACNHESMTQGCGGTPSKPSSSTESQTDNGYGQEPEHDEEVTESTKATDQPSESTTDSVKSPTSDDKCTTEGFFPDSNDCKKFYRCVDNGRGGYTKYDFTCGEGTVWDQEVQACNHPSGDNNCKKDTSQSKPVSGTTQSSQEESTTSKQEETTSKQDQSTSQSSKPPQSDGKCESEGFYADENDCKKFYRCVDNGKGGYTKYDFACGEGTVWDQEIQGCNFESNVNCIRGSQSSSSQQSETTQSNQQQTTERQQDEEVTPETESDKEQDKPNSGSGGKCTSEGFYANENNCKKFYRCVDDGKGGYTRYDFDCGEGTAWDQDAQTCNHENTVDCKSSGESSQSEPPPDKEDNEPTEDTDKPSSESSSQESTTQKQQSSNGKCEDEGYFGNPDDCKKFYRCVDNGKGGYTKYDFDCGEGTIWDQDLTTCNHPGDVKNPSCKEGDGSQSSTTSSTSQQSSSSTTESSQPEQSSSSSESDSSSSKPTKVSCPEAGFYANPDDCKKFYRCVDFQGDGKSYTVFHFDCGEGTIWDPNLDTCNYEDSIYPPRDCSKQSQNQEVDNTEESTTSTTTQKSTTEEQTTTESTTTQQSTTEEQTATQQSTTQEETTTEKTTTSSSTTTTTTTTTTTESSTKQEETTTEESTTTTTEGTTTTEESTTTTTEGTTTTTEESTTTTTEGTTTTEESTTTTTEGTTTTTEDSPTTTTEDSTTKESTTEESTTQESTTEESTTEESTTESQTESQTEGTTEEQENQTDSTTEESTTESSTEDSGTTESSSSDKECPETDDDQYLLVCPTGFKRHPKYCNLFYQCTEDSDNHDIKVATFHCENNTIYDEGQNKCVKESETDQKCDGEIAERRRFKRLSDNSRPPISTANARLKCPAEGHFPFDQKDDCSPAFLKCQRSKATQKLRAFVYRCPEGFTYWSVSRRCEHSSKMKECRAKDNLWTGRWEIPIETSNIARWR